MGEQIWKPGQDPSLPPLAGGQRPQPLRILSTPLQSQGPSARSPRPLVPALALACHYAASLESERPTFCAYKLGTSTHPGQRAAVKVSQLEPWMC